MANPYFNATYYLANNPDVFAAGINTAEGAWAHYEQYGAAEALNGAASRSPAPWFDIAYYLAKYPDLNTAGLTAGQLFGHFTEYGLAEGRSPSPAAEGVDAESLAAYAAANEDLRTAFGIKEGEEPTEAQLVQLAQHFYQFGYKENRDGLPAEFSDDTPGQTFTLTTDIGETIVGTNGDDTINGIIDATTPANSTWNTFDSIDGRGGRDTLNLLTVGAGAAIPPTNTTLANVEVIRVTSETELTAIDVSTLDGVDSVVVAGAGATAVTLGEGQSVTLANSAATSGGVTVNVDADETDTTITLAGVASGETVTLVGGANESLTVNGAVAGAGAVAIAAATTTETLNLGLTSDSTVTITGAALTDIDASGSTGDVVMAAAVATVETITGGEGDDTLIGGGASKLIEGGAGDDTITAGNVADEVIIGGLGADQITLGAAGQAQEVVINVGDSGLTLATMDEIINFITTEDTLNFGLAEGDADNFLDGGASSSFIDALTNANTAFTTGAGELQYFFSNDGTDGFLFIDADLNGTADMAIQLTGVITIAATDIIAEA